MIKTATKEPKKYLTKPHMKEMEIIIEKHGQTPEECAKHIADYCESIIEFNVKKHLDD